MKKKILALALSCLMLVGLVAGAIAYGLVAALYHALLNNLNFDNPLLTLIPFSDLWGTLLTGFLVGGVLVGICGSIISMGKYLRHEGGLR